MTSRTRQRRGVPGRQLEGLRRLSDSSAGTCRLEYGGRGRDILTAVCLLEALGYGCRDNGLTLAINAQIWTIQEPLLTFGSEEQKRRYLPRLCAGELLAADAVTEEGAGLRRAQHVDDRAPDRVTGTCSNGRKTFIGMAPIADVALVFAKTDPDAGQWGISAFLVEKGTPGFTATASRSKSGLRTMPMGGFELVDCVVPESSRLGAGGRRAEHVQPHLGVGAKLHPGESCRCHGPPARRVCRRTRGTGSSSAGRSGPSSPSRIGSQT